MNNFDKNMAEPEKQARKGSLVIASLIVVALIGTVIFAFMKPDEEPEDVPESQLKEGWYDEVLSHLPPEPEIPEQAPEETPPAAPAIVLPSLDDSDALAQEQITQLNRSHQLLPWLGIEHIIRRAVTVANGLGEGVILGKLLKVPGPKGQFRADKTAIKAGDKTEPQYWISKDNYQRYEYLVNVITSADKARLIDTYRLLHPLMETAYGELGVPDRTFDEVVINAMDQILAAPKLDAPAQLKLTSVTYTFVDPTLESLPPIQKLLIRMGPENTRKIQQAVQELRAQILSKGGALGQKSDQ